MRMVSRLRRATRIFINLMPDALPRQDRKTGPFSARGSESLGVGFGLPVLGVEPEKPQDPQVILANTRPRVADESDAASLEIGDAARYNRGCSRRD